MSVTAGVSDGALATRAKLQGGISQTRVGRYWPGKAPKWGKEEHDDDDDHVGKYNKKKKVDAVDDELERNKEVDSRLRRLGQTTRAESRVREAAEVISTEELMKQETTVEEEEEEEDVEALEERRSRIREKNLKRTREEADLQLPLEEDQEEVQDEEEEEEESEYETDSEGEMFGIYMTNPVFKPKAERESIAERERIKAEEEALEKLEKKKLMRIETKAIVVEEVRKDEARRKNAILEEEANLGDVDTDDEKDEAEAYEAWKTRELGRIKREKEARGEMCKEKEEVDKLRNMTEQERKEWESNDPKPLPSSSEKPKKKWKFMQRYYHKGAYFQEQGSDEADGIYKRDYSAPTGVDRLDKSVLREVMQVKNFGRSGGTKWTHLVKEDTTYGGKNKKEEEEDKTKDWSDPWVSNVFLRRKYNKRVAAMDAPMERPRGSKRMKAW